MTVATTTQPIADAAQSCALVLPVPQTDFAALMRSVRQAYGADDGRIPDDGEMVVKALRAYVNRVGFRRSSMGNE